LPAAQPVTTFLLRIGWHRQYKPPANLYFLYFLKLPRYIFYILSVHFYIFRCFQHAPMSALPPKADMVQHDRDVRFVPEADKVRRSK
jgi:hypothetical protein